MSEPDLVDKHSALVAHQAKLEESHTGDADMKKIQSDHARMAKEHQSIKAEHQKMMKEHDRMRDEHKKMLIDHPAE